MKWHLNRLFLQVAVIAMCAGCGDGGGGGGGTEDELICTPQEKECDGSDLVKCNSAGTDWDFYKECASGCEAGACKSDGPCEPSCSGKACGDDGCGGTCGQCAAGTTCRHGRCESDKAETAARLVSTARSEMRDGRYEKALDKLNEAAAVDGESLEIKNLRSDCYVGIKAREVKKLLAKARAALSRKDFDSCLDAAAKAGRLDPGNGEAAKLRKECKEKKDLEGMKF